MRRVALTGGIATGKTYVLRRLASLGVPTIDADHLAREVVRPGRPALRAIVERFGTDIVDAQGALDRKQLAAVVFDAPEARLALERIVHPEVYQAIDRWFADAAAAGSPVGVADIPLLYETGHEADFDQVIVTACAPETQLRRARARDGANAADTRQRLAAQWPIGAKVARADRVIWTDGTLEDTDRQVNEIMREWGLETGRS